MNNFFVTKSRMKFDAHGAMGEASDDVITE